MLLQVPEGAVLELSWGSQCAVIAFLSIMQMMLVVLCSYTNLLSDYPPLRDSLRQPYHLALLSKLPLSLLGLFESNVIHFPRWEQGLEELWGTYGCARLLRQTLALLSHLFTKLQLFPFREFSCLIENWSFSATKNQTRQSLGFNGQHVKCCFSAVYWLQIEFFPYSCGFFLVFETQTNSRSLFGTILGWGDSRKVACSELNLLASL